MRKHFACVCSTAAVLIGFASLLGCGDSNGGVTVSGKITYDGNPVTSGLINFQPQGGRPLGGAIRADGTYSAEIPPGDYAVRIDAPAPLPQGFKEGDPVPDLPPLVPEKFANYDSSGLTATVKPDARNQTIDFNLP
jgi:hypothetical protein